MENKNLEKVLVIEDSQTMNNIISKKVSSLGYSVDKAYSLSQADEFLSKNKYEFIILDLHLPDGEGFDLIASIQSITSSRIIVLTSLKDDYVREELFKFGILDYIVKDVNLNYSIEEVVRLIKLTKEERKEKILIIDDSKFVCNQVKRILTPRNYIVEDANTGQQALEKLKKENYSLIILDMTLPDIEGLELLSKIRDINNYITTPVIILSGTADADTVRKILKNGANEYIKKPFVFEEFVLKVDFWIKFSNQAKEIIEKTKQLEELNKNLEQRVQEEVKKNLEKDRLMFAQARLAQMGEILNIVAHQWKQPLNALSAVIAKTYLRYKKTKTLDEEIIKFCYENVNLQLEDMTNTIKNFMNFFKPDKSKEEFNLYENIRGAVKILKATLENSKIKVNLNVDKTINIKGFANEFNQVILNILSNSKDAFDKIDQTEKIINIIANKEKDKVFIHIEDSAGGIPEEIIDKIFEPYFSTKSNTGTGLGLYISKLVIEEHMNGKLSVENTSKGAKFTIQLPIIS